MKYLEKFGDVTLFGIHKNPDGHQVIEVELNLDAQRPVVKQIVKHGPRDLKTFAIDKIKKLLLLYY